MNLRPYQRKACAETWRGLQTEHTLLESPTGTGKTVMALAVSEKAVTERCGPVLIVAPTDEIYGQMIATYQRAGWMVHADKAERHAQPAKAMEQALDGCKVVIVASLGTLRLRDRVERYPRDGWALTILDECFPAGTLVDGRPIESLRIGDRVRSYNHQTQRTEHRPVTRLFASQPAHLVTVYLTDGRTLTCTAGHPFFVGASYRPAIHLKAGDPIYGTSNHHAPMCALRTPVSCSERYPYADLLPGMPASQTGCTPQASAAHPVRGMRCNRRSARCDPASCRAGILLGAMQADVVVPPEFADHGRHQSAPRQCAHGGSQSDATAGGARQGEPVSSGHWTCAGCARRQRPRADGDGGKIAGGTARGVEGQPHRADAQGSRCWLSHALQARPCAAERADCCGGGWRKSWRAGEACAGCQEDGVSPITRVDRVEVHERRGGDGFGSLCPGDRVYNIEVEGNHNYFVDGILVHNCHHAPASTWQGVREYFDQPWMGMTATPERKGMKPLWPVHVRAFEKGLMEAIREGWLVPFDHQYACGVSQDDYEAMHSDDAREVDPALTAALATITEHLQGRQGLSFWPRTRAAKQAAKALRADGTMTARALVGKGMPPDERKLALRQYAANTLQMLTLCQVGVEGLDVPPAAMLAIFQQTKSKVRIAQQVGRVLRPDAACLAGLDEATAEERRAAIAASSKPSALVASIAPPAAIDGWETPGRLLWGDLPEPVLIEIDRRQRAGKDLETARKEALQAEVEQAAKRKAAREEHERREAAAAPARARAVAEARPYELQDHADAAKQARRQTITREWERWTNRANAALLANADAQKATAKQAAAIAKLSCEYLRVPANPANVDKIVGKVLEWDSKTAQAAQHRLRCMTGHFQAQRQRVTV